MDAPVFVARERELHRLDRFLDAALAGEGQICFVSGEAGSGKTALVTEFARRAEAQHPDLVAALGQADAQTGIGDPYLPFREILGLLTGDEAAQRARAISSENSSRLGRFVGVSARFLVEIAPDLVGLLLPGGGLAVSAVRAGAGMAGWLGKLEKLGQQPGAAAALAGALAVVPPGPPRRPRAGAAGALNSATYLLAEPSASATHATAAPSRITCRLFVECWFTCSTSSFVSSASVKSSLLGKFAPMISGDRAMHHRFISVNSSSCVKFVFRPGVSVVSFRHICNRPTGSMSASGKWPGPR